MFVHRIDPVIAEVRGVYLWWYGFSYALGSIGVRLSFSSNLLPFSPVRMFDETVHSIAPDEGPGSSTSVRRTC
jgi:prolipoprotein diacylglyceryltransferase